VFTVDEQTLSNYKVNDPYLYQEMTLKKSISFKDPSKNSNSSPHKNGYPILIKYLMNYRSSWNLVNDLPTKQLDKIMRPKILDLDAQGCDNIIGKINDERKYEEMEKQWI
jgi:hypothetical protein